MSIELYKFLENPFVFGNCVACASKFKIFLRLVGGARTRRLIPLYLCLDCNTLSCISDYKESAEQLLADVNYNVRQLDFKVEHFSELAQFLAPLVGLGSHADVGCNLGILVSQFSAVGFSSIGYDLNASAIKRGRELFPTISLFEMPIGRDGRTFDFITLIDVLEHINDPETFMTSVKDSLNPGGYAFVVVPRVDRNSWIHLSEPLANQLQPRTTTPFRDNDVHIVHYSSLGLTALGKRLGFTVVHDYSDKPWPKNGILFQKNC